MNRLRLDRQHVPNELADPGRFVVKQLRKDGFSAGDIRKPDLATRWFHAGIVTIQ